MRINHPILAFIAALLPIAAYGQQGEREGNEFVIGASIITNIFDGGPYGGYLSGGYEYKLTQPSRRGHYLALEGRITGGGIVSSCNYEDYMFGLSALPRFYYNVNYFNLLAFAEVEGGGTAHFIHGDSGERGTRFSLVYGVRVGLRAGSVAIWAGFVERGAERRVNAVVQGVPVDSSITGEIGVAVCF